VSSAAAVTATTKSVKVMSGAPIVVEIILLQAISALYINPDMRLLQANIQSIHTSLSLLRQSVARSDFDAILLQEIWQPDEASLNIRNFTQPITKIRTDKSGGGVAIFTHRRVKTVHLKEFDVNGLEAVWADVLIGKVRTVLGSVYIPPGNIEALDLLDEVLGRILSKHSNVIICMDANSRNPLWDLSCLGMNPSQKSIKMGSRLEDILEKYHIQIHNDGSSTYHSSTISTAPNVTLSTNLTQFTVWQCDMDIVRR